MKIIERTLPEGKTAEEIKQKIADYLLSILPDEDTSRFHGSDLSAIKGTALAEKFASAYERRYYRWNRHAAIRDWLQGLGMGVAFTYYDIANLMREWGFKVDENDDDDYYEKCDLYWDIVAQVIYEAE